MHWGDKYSIVRQTLRNGDICELDKWSKNIPFGIYMDGYLYKKQDNGLVVAIGGFEPMVTAIRRPECIRNAFQCFTDAGLDYDYRKYGSFSTVYIE